MILPARAFLTRFSKSQFGAKPANGLRYPLVGGTRQRCFAGISFKPRKLLENAQTPTRRVHALLGVFLTNQDQCRSKETLLRISLRLGQGQLLRSGRDISKEAPPHRICRLNVIVQSQLPAPYHEEVLAFHRHTRFQFSDDLHH